MKPDWWPSWGGETCILVASGPSAKNVPLEIARGKARFIAINSSWQLAPWADILFGCDFLWWEAVDGCPEFKGLKLCLERRAVDKPWGIRKVNDRRPDDRMVFDELGTVGWGGNSGFHAYNLAVQFGCAKIIFVGYDMQVNHGIHWHGLHPGDLHNPNRGNTERWRRAVDAPAKMVADRGIKVINCSPVSALRNYPKMTLEEALAA